jgi:hypothetical protein
MAIAGVEIVNCAACATSIQSQRMLLLGSLSLGLNTVGPLNYENRPAFVNSLARNDIRPECM